MADRVDRAIRDLCATLLPAEAGGPDAVRLAAQTRAYLDRAPATTRSLAEAGFVAIAAAQRLAAGAPARDLDAAARAAALRRVMDARPEAYAAVEGLKAIVLLAHGSEQNREAITVRAHRDPPGREDPDIDVTPSRWWPDRATAGAVVIGSGAGGAMAARTLARAGVDVVVVEEGRRWTLSEIRDTPAIERYAGLYRDAGTTLCLGWPPVVLPIGRAVGGTTVVNSGTCYRPPRRVMERWYGDAGLALAHPDRLDPLLAEVETTLGVGPVPLDVMGANGHTLLRGAEALGWRAGPIVRNASGCRGSCQCALGCPNNAKSGVHLNALPQASAAGARLLSEARVRRLLVEGGRVTGIEASRPDGTLLRIDTDAVVVAAGAAESPALLWRSELGSHPELGRGLSIHPALSTAGRFEQPVVAWDGVLQSAAVEELHESHGILIEATATPPGMGSMLLPGIGAPLLEAMAETGHLATMGAMIGDEGPGRVQPSRAGVVMRYPLTRRDAAKLVVALSAMGRLLFAAGATEVETGVPGAAPARDVAELDDVLDGADPRALHLAAFHPTGTARAGRDPERSPVDPEGRLRGVDGVWVADACLLPSCPEVNPQVSIMALALGVAEGMVDRLDGRAVSGELATAR